MKPASAAATVRESWGLGVRPISSLVHLVELHGVRVFSLSEQSRQLDAFALWFDARPFCFVNTLKSAEHGRFDVAHELGHLVLHRHGQPIGRQAEEEADAFASAFLMPESTVVGLVPRSVTLQDLVHLKQRHGVSVAALTHRAHRLGIITDWQYRNLFIEMARRGYRTTEPAPITNRETSQILNKVFASLREEGISKADVARELGVVAEEVEAMVFGLVVTAMDGGGAGPTAPRTTSPVRLTLVK